MNIKEILDKIVQAYRAFMYGRYGSDALNIAIMVVGFLLSGVLSLIRVQSYGAYYIIRLISLLPYALLLFRSLSKNIAARQKENDKFLKLVGPIKDRLMKKMSQAQDTAHKYYRCPSCKSNLRVPSGHGRIRIQCPHCGHEFEKDTGTNTGA